MNEQEPQTDATSNGAASALTAGLGAVDWCPTRHGQYTAYEPMWLRDGDWAHVPTERRPGGVPQPLLSGGVNSELGLYGYAQAQALAWGWAAMAAAEGKTIEVKVQAYEVVYDLKARKIEEAPNV